MDAYRNAGYGKAKILEEPISVEKVTLNSNDLRLPLDSTYQMEFTISPENADSIGVVWSSGNNNVVTVTDDGKITGLKRGKVYVYVESKTYIGIKDSCLVTVYQPVTGIQLNNSEKEIKVGESFSLTTTINPSDADDKSVIWQSENDSIATVIDGKVTGVKAGAAKIIATSVTNNDISATCEVTVLQPVEGIKLDKESFMLGSIGETIQLVATILPEDASNKNINWRSSDESVCIVSNGKVVAVGYGTAVIIATTADGGYMAVCTIKVDQSTGIGNIRITDTIDYDIYDIEGKKLNSFRQGINIIKFKTGELKKIVIK